MSPLEAHAPVPAFLGVERSVTGRRWRARLADDRAALMLAQMLGVPEIVARLLVSRGVGGDAAGGFLNPRLRDLLPDPARFRDMDRAVARLVTAIRGGERIAVFGDYDVDGATSAALLHRFFAAAGLPLRLYIPDRLAEGYGPNKRALLRLQAEGIAVVMTVDCGITAFEPLAAAAAVGLDVIVLDHHVAEPALPQAAAVINPNRLDEPPGHGQLAAVGVAFLLVVALNRALRQAGFYGPLRPEPDLMQWLDLVALGTICDVVPLTGLNRALVAQGLKVMARRGNPGLAALADVAGVSERLGTYHVGFVLGPRVNAGGRIGAADLGARLLSTDDPAVAAELAQRLDGYNRERRESVFDQRRHVVHRIAEHGRIFNRSFQFGGKQHAADNIIGRQAVCLYLFIVGHGQREGACHRLLLLIGHLYVQANAVAGSVQGFVAAKVNIEIVLLVDKHHALVDRLRLVVEQRKMGDAGRECTFAYAATHFMFIQQKIGAIANQPSSQSHEMIYLVALHVV